MDPEAFLYKWDHQHHHQATSGSATRGIGIGVGVGLAHPLPSSSSSLNNVNINSNSNRMLEAAATTYSLGAGGRVVVAGAGAGAGGGQQQQQQQQLLLGLEELFQAYGIRYYTAAKIAELGFTASTLSHMTDQELDNMMNSLSHIYRWDLLVGERYGIKAAVRAQRRRLSEEPVQQEKEAAASGGGGGWEVVAWSGGISRKKQQQPRQRRQRKKDGLQKKTRTDHDDQEDGDDCEDTCNELDEREAEAEAEEDIDEQERSGGGSGGESRQREHPFIVTEPGEVARGKKNGLDYLFHLYDQCRDFLLQVQSLAKDRGEKCPTKVTNQVFRYAKKAGASYINKPKMRHYVHCYALHCLDEEASNSLRRAYKERGENVGAWRQACYKPLVSIAARQGWDIDAIFNSHPRLAIWYVPTKLRQLCHAERSRNSATASSSAVVVSTTGPATDHLPPIPFT
ncbi:Floricaula/leafy, DNA-binding C-terminal domain [Dillenia turbinata]|uniref:Floricaula/leafy-like transcription factor n=1 Tax=Dillenia turbinata TaxID=194707 RepID=A0AAN8UTP8_9MAGN